MNWISGWRGLFKVALTIALTLRVCKLNVDYIIVYPLNRCIFVSEQAKNPGAGSDCDFKFKKSSQGIHKKGTASTCSSNF